MSAGKLKLNENIVFDKLNSICAVKDTFDRFKAVEENGELKRT